MKIRVFHTGKVYVSKALPFKDAEKNPNPFQLTILTPYGRRNRVWLPVSAYLIEHERAKILVDTGRHREISPDGEYNRRAQIRHRGLGHFLLNQGVVPKGQSIVEQLAALDISPRDLDFVILTHLHTDHASGLRQLTEAKKHGVNFEPFAFADTGVGSVGKSFDLFGDGSIELVNIPGHTSGLAAVKVNRNGKFVLLFSDGGYAKKSWQELISPGTALDEELAFKSLLWIRQMSSDENCVENLANHDPDIEPHEIVLD